LFKFVFCFFYLIIPANFCILLTVSDTSEIISCLPAVCDVPVALDAKDLCSLIVAGLVTTFLETVSKTNFTSFTVSALSKAATTFTFCDSDRLFALKTLFT
jgi:hypothetical protein